MKYLLPLLLLGLCGCVSFHIPHFSTKIPMPKDVGSAIEKANAMMWPADVILWLSVPFLVWREHLFCAGLTALSALMLPVLTVFVSEHIAWVVAGSIILGAVVFFIHYRTVIWPIENGKG